MILRLLLLISVVHCIQCGRFAPKLSILETFRKSMVAVPRVAVRVGLFGFSRDNAALSEILLSDVASNGDISVTQWNSTSLQPSNVVVGLVTKYALKDFNHRILPVIQSYIDDAVRRKQESKLVLLLESDNRSIDVQSLVSRCGEMIENAVSEDGSSSSTLIDIDVLLLPINRSSEKWSRAVSRAKDAITASVKISKPLILTSSPFGKKVVTKPAAGKSINAREGIAAVDCTNLEESFVTEVTSQFTDILENHVGNMTETLSLLSTVLKDALSAHTKAHARLLTQYQGTEALHASEVRARLSVVAALTPIFARLAEELTTQAEEQHKVQLRAIKLNQEYPTRVQALTDQTVRGVTEELVKLQSDLLSLVQVGEKGSLWSSTLGGVTSSNSSTGWKRLLRLRRSNHVNIGNHGNGRLSVPLRVVLTTALTSFSVEGILRPLHHRLSSLCKELVATSLYRGTHNPYLRSPPALGVPLRLGLHYLGTPSQWPGILYDRMHYEPQPQGKVPPYANRAKALRVPGVASVPFDPREAPESVEEPHARRTDWWMDALPQWARYRVLRRREEYQ